MPGHTVLQLPAPPLEAWVAERTRHHDASFVSSDPGFAHAHITALAPFVRSPTRAQLRTITGIATATAPITVQLGEIDQFPDGIIHLRPEPDRPLRDLTDALVDAFPDCPPYEGRFGPRVDPHLTLDAASGEVTVETTRRLLGGILPVSCTLTELQLAWWESGGCHVMHRWRLSGPAAGRRSGEPAVSPGQPRAHPAPRDRRAPPADRRRP
ncbi:2'-5' RNA ligase family protein [Janibacter sp. GS2]|uniref:2'-5' RNA ligase family protein n=1 Tax=Janibacter sp. GS2 TaxID=3442646 RepID=UPI003EB96F9F